MAADGPPFKVLPRGTHSGSKLLPFKMVHPVFVFYNPWVLLVTVFLVTANSVSEYNFYRLDLTGKCSSEGELVTAPQLGCGFIFQCFISGQLFVLLLG